MTGGRTSLVTRAGTITQCETSEGAANFWTSEIRDMAGIDELRERMRRRDGTKFATIKVRCENPPRVLPPRDGVFNKNRFRAALGRGPV